MDKHIKYMEEILEKEKNEMQISLEKANLHCENMEIIKRILAEAKRNNPKKKNDLREKAGIILKEIDKQYIIPEHKEEYVLQGIIAGLKKIDAGEGERLVNAEHRRNH
ncbi:MAG: hypothetical protein ACI4D2_06490 [Lachnospiraceae bacterium]